MVSRFFSVEATEKECVALAERFSCESIAGLKADLRVVRAAGSEGRKIKIKVCVEKFQVLDGVAMTCREM